MAARPWESTTNQSFITGREHPSINDRSSIKSVGSNKASSRKLISRPSPSTPPSVPSNYDDIFGFQSKQHRRRHSIGSSFCFGDVENRAKSRFQAPLTGKSCKAKKPLPLTSAARRFSGPQKMASYGKGWY